MNNTNVNQTLIPITISDNFKMCFVLITALIIIVGVIGNCLVIYVVTRFSSMQTIANIHLMNLSIADLVFLISGFIFLSNVIQKSFIFGLIGCKIYLIMTGVNSFTSTYSMTLMSIDRYLAVCHPISSKSIRNPKMTKWIILGLWLFSFVLMLPLMIYGNLQSPIVQDSQSNHDDLEKYQLSVNLSKIDASNNSQTVAIHACMINWNMSGKFASHGFTLYNFALGFLCPVTIICILYPLVIIRLRNVGPRNKSQERRDSNRRITRLVLAIIVIYIILWLPYWILQLFLIFYTLDYSNEAQLVILYLNLAMLCLNYLNSAINPILYAFMSANFRGSFRQLIVGHQHRAGTLGATTCQGQQETIITGYQNLTKQKNCQHVILNEPLIEKTGANQTTELF